MLYSFDVLHSLQAIAKLTMYFIPEQLNIQTQQLREHTVFNNWDVMTEGWYIALKSSDLKKATAKSCLLGKQRIVFFRGDSGSVYALDAFCPHMGVDLGLGNVIGENIQCLFHHWQFNENGQCVDIPCQEEVPSNVCLAHYAVTEKYGYIWIWPDQSSKAKVLEIPELEDKAIFFKHDEAYFRGCHFHITMVNGIDAQHLRTVHDLAVNMQASLCEPQPHHLEISMRGEFPQGNKRAQWMRKLFGGQYAYRMIYAYGTIGALTMMQNVKLFGKWNLPMLHMLYAYLPLKEKRSKVVPIYVTQKRKGVLGWIISHFLLWLTQRLFYFLKEEDGMIYENIRFNTNSLLKIDQPIAKYIAYINRLKPSKWSARDIGKP
ncbi:Rieske 2Fe-2S domain-containing protein [Candidatus Berkiella aquae]|uniref:Aromatic ring-hydroxylating dioxygenase subunit alpha n=2 Tax=Candidatus Berkiella aquae TaxID=295108 RepID=A0AAE3L7X1_9GAMM|nr:aromatic ring-hydroxylating dioxygenase subunit alpha [Candidatus Berkiella aquae]MCS5710325.1 aromatic ring-hydroxylating dioxygenase subunit alpha [Candidatus Berkiella aquae]